MAKQTIIFSRSVGEQVTIAAIGMIGRIDSLSIDNNGPMIRVVYWNDGHRYSQWLYEWELQPEKENA